jgi:hypothetical protein
MTAAAAPPPSDDALDAELRRVAALADPVPDHWHDVARAGFAWAAIDAAPAHLTYDSRSGRSGRLGGGPLSGAAPRELRFVATGSLGVEVEIDVGADKLRVLGRLVPARIAEVVALWPGGRREAVSEPGGTFRFDELPRLPLCLHVCGEHSVKTGWIVA